MGMGHGLYLITHDDFLDLSHINAIGFSEHTEFHDLNLICSGLQKDTVPVFSFFHDFPTSFNYKIFSGLPKVLIVTLPVDKSSFIVLA